MGIKVHLYSGLMDYTGGKDVAEVTGANIGECLNDIARQYPRLKNILFGKDAELLKHVFVSVNLKSAYPEQLGTPVVETDELHIALIIVGG